MLNLQRFALLALQRCTLGGAAPAPGRVGWTICCRKQNLNFMTSPSQKKAGREARPEELACPQTLCGTSNSLVDATPVQDLRFRAKHLLNSANVREPQAAVSSRRNVGLICCPVGRGPREARPCGRRGRTRQVGQAWTAALDAWGWRWLEVLRGRTPRQPVFSALSWLPRRRCNRWRSASTPAWRCVAANLPTTDDSQAVENGASCFPCPSRATWHRHGAA